jgi:peptidoglycan/LPS O-acetylase OafA/YrhL
LKYRREIDGLRAVAVLPVILFHAGFELFSGGFVGVDVFFVISGYLITTIILAEKEKETFSLVNFYERRARRILPALFFVMICCFPFAWLWLLPNHLKEFSKSLIYISSFSSNFLFWKESGYFATAAELKPLLHTWSLAVEEQYYMFFPLFLMLIWKFRKRFIFGSLVVVTVASLILAQMGAYHAPSATFYLLPTRFWELAIGALISFYFLYKKKHVDIVTSNHIVNEVFGMLGLLLICYSIFAFDKATPFPGFYALVPTVGTGFIIVFATAQTFVGRLLGANVLVGVGLISYSAYLWHNPLFVFARHQSLTEPSVTMLLSLSGLSIVLAYFSWRFVEIPFRNKGKVDRKKIFYFALFGSLFFIITGMIGVQNNGFDERFSISKSVLDSFSGHTLCKVGDDVDDGSGVDINFFKLGSKAENAIKIAVFGDSHAAAILPAFDTAGKKLNYSVVYTGKGGCPPLLGVDVAKGNFNKGFCEQFTQRQYDYVKENEIKKVFLVSRWSFYTDGEYEKNMEKFFLISNDSDKMTQESSRKNFDSSLRRTIEAYRQIGTKVIVILQIPQQDKLPKYVYSKMGSYDYKEKNTFLQFNSVSLNKHNKLQKFNRDVFDKYSNELKSINLDDTFCHDGKCLLGSVNQSYYIDSDHVSVAGTKLFTNIIVRALQDE